MASLYVGHLNRNGMEAGHSQNSLPFYVISGLLPVVSLAGWSSDFLNGSSALSNNRSGTDTASLLPQFIDQSSYNQAQIQAVSLRGIDPSMIGGVLRICGHL